MEEDEDEESTETEISDAIEIEEEEEEEVKPDLTEKFKTVKLEERVGYIQQLGEIEGLLESPINLNIATMVQVELDPLKWYNYHNPPKKVKLTNTAVTVVLSAIWQYERPWIEGGPLSGKYIFSQCHFHWGANEMVGSEHGADGSFEAMELHAVHYKASYLNQNEAMRYTDGVIILVYLFKVHQLWTVQISCIRLRLPQLMYRSWDWIDWTKQSCKHGIYMVHNWGTLRQDTCKRDQIRLQQLQNPMLAELLEALKEIQKAGDSTRMASEGPLTYLMRPFNNDYIVYWGSISNVIRDETTSDLTQTDESSGPEGPKHAQGVMWFICRHPIGIAVEQASCFRTLHNLSDEPIIENCRQLQGQNDRGIFHVNPSGHTSSTIILITSDPPPPTANQCDDDLFQDLELGISEVSRNTVEFYDDP